MTIPAWKGLWAKLRSVFRFRQPSADEVDLPQVRLVPRASQVSCPECKQSMEEGYLVKMGPIHWKKRGQGVGLPKVLGSLAGALALDGRPRLHAFHCPACKNIFFKYGKQHRAVGML